MNVSMHILHAFLLSMFLGLLAVLLTGAAPHTISAVPATSTVPTIPAAPTIPIIETEDLNGTFHWRRISISASDTSEAHAHTAFEHFFKYGSYAVPQNVKMLNVSLLDGLLTVDVSEDILSYDGSAFEQALTKQLIKIAAEIPTVERFTLTTEGALRPLIHGTKIDGISISAQP